MALLLEVDDGVHDDVRALLMLAAPILDEVFVIAHAVRVRVFATATIPNRADEAAGVFLPPLAGGPAVGLTGGARDPAGLFGMPRKRAIEVVVENLVHELVHYGQWKNGLPFDEQIEAEVKATTEKVMDHVRAAWRSRERPVVH